MCPGRVAPDYRTGAPGGLPRESKNLEHDPIQSEWVMLRRRALRHWCFNADWNDLFPLRGRKLEKDIAMRRNMRLLALILFALSGATLLLSG